MVAAIEPADRTGATSDDGIWIPVHDTAAAGTVRRVAASLGAEAGLSAPRLGELAIVATEIATNLARHAVEGRVLVRVRRSIDDTALEIIAIDWGPGMADVMEWTADGRSTAGTLGIGFGAIARQTNSFDVYSLPGTGTVLAVCVGNVAPGNVGGLTRPIIGDQICGDAYASRELDGRQQIMLCDGLGHGALAALAARAAKTQFLSAPWGGPRDVLEFMHERTRHTRGVVAAVAELDRSRVRFAGIGNIAGSIVDANGRRTMVSLPGIVGQQRRETREFEYPWGPGGVVVLHSDGVTDRWDLAQRPGLADHSALVIAATLLRDAGTRHDDAAVLVARAA